MRTAWKAIPTLSRTCAHCCSGLRAAHGSTCAAGIHKKLDEWESLTDAPERHTWQQPNGTGFQLRARDFGCLALQVAHLAREAALTRGVRRAFRRSRGSCPAPRHRPPAAARQLNAGVSRKNSGQFAVFFLLSRAGAVLNVVKSAAGQSIAVYGVSGSAS